MAAAVCGSAEVAHGQAILYDARRATSDNPAEAGQIMRWHDATPFTDTTAAVGQTYYYWVRATQPQVFASSPVGFGAPGSNASARVRLTCPTQAAQSDPVQPPVFRVEVQIIWSNPIELEHQCTIRLFEDDLVSDDSLMDPWVVTIPSEPSYGPGDFITIATRDLIIDVWDYAAFPDPECAVYATIEFGTDVESTSSLMIGELNPVPLGPTLTSITGHGGGIDLAWLAAAGDSGLGPVGTGVRPAAAPTGVAAIDGTLTDQVVVTWNSVPEATHYVVYRHLFDDPDGAALARLWSPETTFEDTAVPPGTHYFYWVKAAISALGEAASDFRTPDQGWRGLDCNDNSIPDDCDIDCNAPDCSGISGCGQSEDCNGNGVPDECDLAADGDTLFFDDFSARMSQWTDQVSGTWSIDNGRLQGTGAGVNIDARIYAGDKTWKDYTLTAMVYFVEVVADLFVRRTDAGQYYYRISIWCDILDGSLPSVNRNIYVIGCMTTPSSGGSAWVGITPVPITNPVQVRVDVFGKTLRLFINGTLVTTVVDEHAYAPTAGEIGLGTQSSLTALLDDVRVQAWKSQDCNANEVPDECELDSDGDGVIYACDQCPNDHDKSAPGVCGCGVADTDNDSDGLADCIDPCPARRPGDVSGDGFVTFDDVELFVAVLLDPDVATADDRCAADMNCDGAVNGLDVAPFVDCLLNGNCPACPNGSCCHPDGTCAVTTQSACTGIWHAEWTTCAAAQCPPPNGSCCQPDGTCAVTLEADCTGFWTMSGSCTPNTCLAAGMVLIPAGTFQMGDTFSDGYSNELPVHAVYLDAFYMDTHEVTKGLWEAVRTWATTNGYDLGGVGSGKAADHPVISVNWYDCVKWCNARSEKEGRTPCYYTNAELTAIYMTDQAAPYVKWDANGYRLPTEAEWEKAARGCAPGHRFPWVDAEEIQHARANYYSRADLSYDTSPTREYHPTFGTGDVPYTNPVGYFAPNGYGLYDMVGNVWEWCNDWCNGYYDTYYQTTPDSNPHGPASGDFRILRGASWHNNAHGARCAARGYLTPGSTDNHRGFRLVLNFE